MLSSRQGNARPVWTAERLRAYVKTFYGGDRIVVLSNREPFRHERTDAGTINVRRTASGLVTVLEPLVQACSGVWVAHGAGTADRAVVDRRDGLEVPPANPQYRLRRVWLDEQEQRGYYYGWPTKRSAPVP